MELDRFLNLLATVLGGMGSIYVLKALASLSPNIIARLSSTYIGFSPVQIDSLARQKADNIVGIVLVLIALVIAILNLAFVPSDVRIIERRSVAVTLVAALAGVIYVALFFVGNAVRQSQKLTVGRLIATDALNRLLKRERLPVSEVGSLRAYALTLLEMQIDESEPPRQVLQRLAKELDLIIPDGFDFSEVEKPVDL
jgi:hypothetical protein